MAHSCPDCGQACYCDLEDTWMDFEDCLHVCDDEDDEGEWEYWDDADESESEAGEDDEPWL